MKILLLGEYSKLHHTLAQQLRRTGHQVCLVSNGDQWKNYPSDIRLVRKGNDFRSTLCYLIQLLYYLKDMRGYDVVQLINPCFLDLKPKRLKMLYQYLRRYNKRIYLGAFGSDYYWVKTCLENKTFRYSDFWIKNRRVVNANTQREEEEWIGSEKQALNTYIAQDCDGIIACLYEYWAAYKPHFLSKLCYIPLPIDDETVSDQDKDQKKNQLRLLLGIQQQRSIVKGTDIIEPILDQIVADYPNSCMLDKVYSLPFDQYQTHVAQSDILFDQIYSYTPAMNALQAMAQGIVVISGAEPEHYELLGEKELSPIINAQPDGSGLREAIEFLFTHPDELRRLSKESITYIQKHHLSSNVTRQYLDFWQDRS